MTMSDQDGMTIHNILAQNCGVVGGGRQNGNAGLGWHDNMQYLHKTRGWQGGR